MRTDVRIGVDFGGVIVQARDGVSFQETSDPSIAWGEVQGAMEAMRALVEWTGGNVWVVSKAGKRTQAMTRRWMDETRFYGATGLDASRLQFCLKRQEKRVLCAQLDITHFVDDTIDVLQILRGAVPNLYRMAGPEEAGYTPSFAEHVTSWAELLQRLGVGR